MQEFNQRQFELIDHFIDYYENNKLGLGTLVDKIESLIGALKGISEEDYNELLNYWEGLEDVYADMLYQQKPETKLSPIEKEVIKKSLNNLKKKFNDLKSVLLTPILD